MSAKKQLEKEIREAYTFLREKNQTIPSETLQFMLDASLEKLNDIKEPVDLRLCEPGDILISSLGATLEYVRPTKENEYLDHVVRYIEMADGSKPNGSKGTRTHDGFVMKFNRKPEIDHDIIKIIKK